MSSNLDDMPVELPKSLEDLKLIAPKYTREGKLLITLIKRPEKAAQEGKQGKRLLAI